jgi:iron complex transport system substrate-binding protein
VPATPRLFTRGRVSSAQRKEAVTYAGRRPMLAITLAFSALSVIASACASGESPYGVASASADNPSEGTTFPVSVRAANGEVAIAERPARIVSLSPTATEMLFAIGAGDQVVAVDDNSNYPPDAPMTSLSGYEPNVEAIAKFDPDLVVVATDPADLEKSLNAVGVPVIMNPAAEALDDTYMQIEQLGAATGHMADAAELVAQMKSDVEALLDEVPESDQPMTFYHELDQTYYSVTLKTFIGQIYDLVGLRNIADQAKGAAPDYPQLSAEFIIKADPDIIFLADTKCCDQSAVTVAERPGWDNISAVRTGSIVELDYDVASRWGPRVVNLLRTVVQALSKVESVNA